MGWPWFPGAAVAIANYFRLGFFCDRALPATLLEVALNCPSRSTLEALDATDLLVDFDLAIWSLLWVALDQ